MIMVKFVFDDVFNLKNLIEINKEMRKVFNGKNYLIFKENEKYDYFTISIFSERFIHGFVKEDILMKEYNKQLLISINPDVLYSSFNKPKKDWGNISINGKRVMVNESHIITINPNYKASIPTFNYNDLTNQNFIKLNTEDLMDNKKLKVTIDGIDINITKGLIEGLKKSHEVYVTLSSVDKRQRLYDMYLMVDRNILTTVNKYRLIDTK
jgi:hypothetical protein